MGFSMSDSQKEKPIVSLKDVYLAFGEKEVLKGLTFDVYPHEIVSIAGPSGSGKSTILKLISGLIYPDSGEIMVDAKRLGMAFQSAALFNSLTIWENVALALIETTKLSRKKIDARVRESLDTVGLNGTEEMYPEELSGGIQKRVSVARALALQPEILLYDEPSTGLDPVTSAKLEHDMVSFRDKTGVTSIVVTHVFDTIKNVSDRIMILDDGHIVWQGTKQEFLTNQSPYPCSIRDRKPIEKV